MLVTLGLAAAQQGLHFTFTTIAVPGAQESEVYGINNLGVMVGPYIDGNGFHHCFRKTGRQYTRIDDPKSNFSACFGINNHGVIVGYYILPNGDPQAFLYDGKKFVDITPPGASGSFLSSDIAAPR